MMAFYGGWAPYVPVAERRRRAAGEIARLQKAGQPVAPVIIEGRKIAATFWGKAWCDNLESYQDYANRLPRGRTYVRNGSVIDLSIGPREVRARVSGSDIYSVLITIRALPAKAWKSICADCAGGVESLVELLQGRLSKAVMDRVCRQGDGLFPQPAEIRFSCSCPDRASMCKHVAAALYGAGARLDREPELLFRLREVDASEIFANFGAASPASRRGGAAATLLEAGDLSAIFGIEMAASTSPPQPMAESPAKPSPLVKRSRQHAGNGKSKRAGSATPAKARGSRAAAPRLQSDKRFSDHVGIEMMAPDPLPRANGEKSAKVLTRQVAEARSKRSESANVARVQGSSIRSAEPVRGPGRSKARKPKVFAALEGEETKAPNRKRRVTRKITLKKRAGTRPS
jgi:uncharacterized Zn finger protein